MNENECAMNGGPCKHNGTCADKPVGYDCSCKPGYTGIDCETGRLNMYNIIVVITTWPDEKT